MIKISIFDPIIFYLSGIKDEKKEITESSLDSITMHWTLFTIHQTLLKIAHKRPVFIMTSIEVPLYLLVTFIELVSM